MSVRVSKGKGDGIMISSVRHGQQGKLIVKSPVELTTFSRNIGTPQKLIGGGAPTVEN